MTIMIEFLNPQSNYSIIIQSVSFSSSLLVLEVESTVAD